MTMFLSLDLETGGLNRGFHSILEVGAVLFDRETRHEFQCLVENDDIIGDPFALAMNVDVLREISAATKDRTKGGLIHHREVTTWMHAFIRNHTSERIVVCGKNVAGFDLRFLEQLPGYDVLSKLFLHRCLDVGPMYIEPNDVVPPDLKLCMERAGLDGSVSHRALDDARVVEHLIRNKLWRN